ncbi:tetratricopeptide repeat protein [candidate division KSB1 bacterium]|nr:tetratricopeptide repeat protein [candidate division KSB1 bacterium]
MLQPRKRMTKREIKEDPLVTAYAKTQKWIQLYQKYINIALIAVLAVVVIGVFMGRSKNQAELSAEGQMGVIEQYYYYRQFDRAIEGLERIVDSYAGTKSAGRACIFLANSYFENGDYQSAETYYNMYVDDYNHVDLFSAASLTGIAACMENRMEWLSAAQHYEQAGIQYNKLSSAPFNLKSAARCYVKAGEPEKAKLAYESVLAMSPDASFASEIEVLVETL